MGKTEKIWHPNFVKYMEMIVNHPNYKGLPIARKENGDLCWIASAKSDIGKQRQEWALKKAKELGFKDEAGVYAKVMLEIHPTKKKVCQICGKTLSLYYVYPNSNLIKSLYKNFGISVDDVTNIKEVAKVVINKVGEVKCKKFFIDKFGIDGLNENSDLDEILKSCELKCRNGGSKLLGPGAMSNFPDRYDGFHTYNRCCRSKEDKGRSAENLKTYTKDRRAYEYWSDGNIHAANEFMGSQYFAGASADHIGPISLGFIHDSRVLRYMPGGDNSAKRDRLQYDDIEELIKVENRFNISCMSWYSRVIWDYIKNNYKKHPDKLDLYRQALKTNMANFMYALKIIKDGSNLGSDFLIVSFLKNKRKYFLYDYEFDNYGTVINRTNRNITASTNKEVDRFYRIALDSIDEYNDKENRNIKISISDKILNDLNSIATRINKDNFEELKIMFKREIIDIQTDIIKSL